jgi:hypothetical protein
MRRGISVFIVQKKGIKKMEKFKKWIKAAAIRAVKTVAQTAVGVIGASAVLSDVDWRVTVSAAALAGAVSLLTSIAGLPEIKGEEVAKDA